MARYIGEIFLAMDDQNVPEAEEWVQKAISADHRNGLMFHLGRDYRFHAELLYRRREKHAALEAMTRSTEFFRKCGASRDIQEAEKAIATYGLSNVGHVAARVLALGSDAVRSKTDS